MFQVSATTELKAGDRVIVLASTSADSKTLLACCVHVLPTAGTVAHASHPVGMIASVATSTGTTRLSMHLADGTRQSVTVSADPKIRPSAKRWQTDRTHEGDGCDQERHPTGSCSCLPDLRPPGRAVRNVRIARLRSKDPYEWRCGSAPSSLTVRIANY